MGAANGNQVFLRKPGVSTIARTTGGVGAGAYHHIAVTKNGSGPGSVKFYIDGALAPSVDVSAAQVIVDNNTLLTFGSAGTTSADYDEFALYDGGAQRHADQGPLRRRGPRHLTNPNTADKRPRNRAPRPARGIRRPVVATQRTPLTRSPPSSSLSRATSVGPMRSISCIHTADEHSSVTVPARSETGAASRAMA